MKLTTFNSINTPNLRVQTPNIGVNQKSGAMRINGAAVTKMKLKDKMQIILHHDEEDKGQWYLEVVKSDGFILREKTGQTGEGGLVTQSCALVRRIFESINFYGQSGRILIGADSIKNGGVTLWPLITSSLTNN